MKIEGNSGGPFTRCCHRHRAGHRAGRLPKKGAAFVAIPPISILTRRAERTATEVPRPRRQGNSFRPRRCAPSHRKLEKFADLSWGAGPGGIDLLFNNAGVAPGGRRAFFDISDADNRVCSSKVNLMGRDPWHLPRVRTAHCWKARTKGWICKHRIGGRRAWRIAPNLSAYNGDENMGVVGIFGCGAHPITAASLE